MTIQEILKSTGLSDEQIKSVLDSMRENKIYTSSEENLDIRYSKLKGEHENMSSQYKEAQTLIEELKKSSKGNENLQAKVAEYESKVAELSNQLKEEKLASAVKVGLLSEKATDIDYLSFKLKESGELEMDEKDQIKGWKDKVEELKKKFPNQFEDNSKNKIEPNTLKKGEPEGKPEPKTLAEALQDHYESKI
jgi:hypothetical protein